MAEEPEKQEKPKRPLWKRYTWSLTKNDIIDFSPDQLIQCTDLRDNFYECADRVGLMRSNEFCSKYLADLRECRFGWKQKHRLQVIMKERVRQGRKPIPDLRGDMHKLQNGWNTENM